MCYNLDYQSCSQLLRTSQEILSLAAILPALRIYRSATHAHSTINKYIAALARFIHWCAQHDYCPLPASPQTVLEYLRYLQDIGHGIPDTIAQTSPIGCWHHTTGHPVPHSRQLAIYLHGLRRMHVTKRARPFSREDIAALCAVIVLEGPLRAARDIALICFMFAAALRPSEVRNMRREDLDFRPQGVILTIPTSKCSTNKPRTITLAFGHGPLCPVRALQRWLWLAKIESGYVFRRIDRNDQLITVERFGRSTIGLIFERYAERLGLRGKVSPYSTRRGCATTLMANGVTLDQTRRHLRHKYAETTQGYVDDQPVPFNQSLTPMILP